MDEEAKQYTDYEIDIIKHIFHDDWFLEEPVISFRGDCIVLGVNDSLTKNELEDMEQLGFEFVRLVREGYLQLFFRRIENGNE